MSLLVTEPDFRADSWGLAFTVYGNAQPGGSKRAFTNKRTGRAIIVDDNPKAKPWMEEVAITAGTLMKGRDLFDGPLVLQVTFFQPRPKGHFGKKGLRPSAPKYPAKRPDTTKLVRAFEDALKGIAWRDDSQIVDQHAYKRYGEPARAEVRIGVKI